MKDTQTWECSKPPPRLRLEGFRVLGLRGYNVFRPSIHTTLRLLLGVGMGVMLGGGN